MADFACPQCERVFPTEARLKAHRRLAPDHTAPTQSATTTTAKKALDPDAIVDLAVSNTRDLGGLLAGTIAPHVGVAIHGVEGERKGEWIVKSRAVMAGNLIRERARKDARLLRLLLLYNRLFEVPEGLQLAFSMGAALAVDTGRLAPDQEVAFTLMGREMKIAPVRMAIPDVLDYVAAEAGATPPSAAHSANGQQAGEAPVIAGGVEAT